MAGLERTKPIPTLELPVPDLELPAASRVHHRMRRGPDRRRKPAVEGMHGWRPGMPGLIAGKKGYVNWSARIKNYLSEHPEMAATILERWILDAANGVPGARESLIDRVDGKVFALPTVGEGEVQAVRITTVEIVAQAQEGQPLLPYRQVVIDSPAKGEGT